MYKLIEPIRGGVILCLIQRMRGWCSFGNGMCTDRGKRGGIRKSAIEKEDGNCNQNVCMGSVFG